jgi:glycosyltransferase involved in cell wall biosynthesis
MHILMISDVYFPRINGVSTSIQIFRNELIALGHRVTLIAPDYGNDCVAEDVIRIPARKVLLDPEDRMMHMDKVKALLPYLKTQSVDMIHIQTPFLAHYLGVWLAKELKVPSIESYHTFFEEYLYHYVPFVPKSWMRALARRFTHKQCNAVDQIIVPSTAMRAVLFEYGVKKPMSIIPTGMDLKKFSHCNGDRFRSEHKIPPKRPTLVHIGRVAHEKNIGFLLRMLTVLVKNIPDVLLVIAGEGPALPSLKRQVCDLALENNVLFVGYLDRSSALLDCYCAGDAFIFASRTETQGLVLLEAMALGTPVVSTAVMGTIDILEPRKGALIAPEEPAVFAEMVQEILENTFLRERLSKEAVQYVKLWSAPAMAEKLETLYESLAAAGDNLPAYSVESLQA